MLARTLRIALASSVALPLSAISTPVAAQVISSGDLVSAQDSAGNPGQLAISNPDASTSNVSVLAPVVVANWNRFDVPTGTTLNVSNASVAAQASLLNRVIGGSFSNIGGTINASGVNLWLVNQNGILFGSTASVNAASFFASTLDLADADFFDYYGGTDNWGNGSETVSFLTNPNATTYISSFSGASTTPTFVTDGTILFVSPGLNLTGNFDAGTGTANFVAATAIDVVFNAGSPVGYTIPAGTTVASQSIKGTVAGDSARFIFETASGVLGAILQVDANVATTAVPTDTGIFLTAGGASSAAVTVNGDLSSTGEIEADASGTAIIAGNVASGSRYRVTGGSVTLGNGSTVTQQAAGEIEATSTAGAITGLAGLTLRSDTAGTGSADLTLDAATSVNFASTSALVAGNPAAPSPANRSRIRIGTASTLALGNVVAKSLGSLTSNNLVSLSGPIATGNLLLDERLTLQSTGSTITTGNITHRGNPTGANPAIYLVANGNVATGNLATNASAIFLDSAQNVSTGTVSTALGGVTPSGGHIALRAGGSVDAGAISAGRDAVIRAGTTFTGTTITAGDDVDVSATGNVQFTSAQSSGNATGENFTPGGAAGSGSFSVTGEATSPDISVTSSGGNIGVGGGIALAGPGNVTVNAFGSVTLASAIADNDLSGAGTLAVGTSILPSSLTINGAAQGAAVDLQASGSLVLGDVTSTAGIVDLDSTSGAISAGAVSATGGNAQLTAPGAVTTTSIGSSAAIDVDSTGGGALDLGNLNAGTTINLDTSGTVKFGTATSAGTFAIVSSITPSSITANGDITAGSVLFQSNGTVSLKNVSATAPVGSIVLIAGGTLGDIATGTLATNGGDLFATAGRDVIIGDASTALTGTPTAGNVVLYSGGKIASGALTAGDDVYAKAGTTFTGASARAGDDVVITSTGNLSLTNATASGNGTDATAFAFSGTPGTSTAFSYVAENRTGSNVVLGSTAGSVTSTGTVSAASAIDIDSSSSGALILGNLAAGTTIALDGGGALTFGSVSGGATSLAIGGTTAPSSVVSTGAIVVGSLTANTIGALSLSGANRIGTLAGVTVGGTVLVNTVSDLTVSGLVSATGQDVTLKTSGSITLASAGRVVGKIVALSAGQNFVNNRGADAISASDHWVVYSNAPAGDTFGGLDSGNTAIWSSNLASLFPTDVSGDRYVFAYQPTLTVTSTSLSKVYGTDLSGALDGYFTVSGFQPGAAGAYLADTAANTLSGTPSITSAGAISNADVAGSPYSMDIAQGSLAAERGYAIALSSAGQLTVTPKPISATVNVSDKTYDGTTSGTGSTVAGGFVSGDDVRITGGTYTFSDKNVGIDKTVTINGVSLAGADAGNYTLTVPTSTLADILAKAINALVSVDPKIYDGTTAATGTVALSGVVTGDDVGTAGTTFTFSDKNVGMDKTVNVSGMTLTGADAGNYVVTVPATALADILAKAITATLAANDKTYDGTTAATGSLTLDGVISGDSVGTAGTTLAFADKNAGTDKTVTASGTVLTGSDAGNYTLTGSSSALADILAKAITGTVVANDKVYDGTTATTGSVTLTGIVAGDTVSTTGTTFTFSDPNAGVDKTVSVSGTALAGADGGNYTLTLPATALADILKRAIEITANDASKFQGQLDPGLTYTVGGNGLVGGDTASGSLARAPGEVVGDYAIGQGTVTAGANYTITFRAGTFTIRPTPVPNALRTVELPSEVKGIGSGSGLLIEIGRLCPEDDEKCTR